MPKIVVTSTRSPEWRVLSHKVVCLVISGLIFNIIFTINVPYKDIFGVDLCIRYVLADLAQFIAGYIL